MLAYAANTPRPAGRAGSPKALTLILLGHAALISAVMMARMDVVGPVIDEIPKLIPIGPIDPPPPPPPEPQPQAQSNPAQKPVQEPVIDRTPAIVPMGQLASNELDRGPLTNPLPPPGSGDAIVPEPPVHNPIKLGPRFATAANAVRPSYPLDKIRLQEEATLKLRLAIDARGGVTAVEAIGAADPSFLEAARRHILRSWRYKPATEDGVAVPSSTVISLSFRLEDA